MKIITSTYVSNNASFFNEKTATINLTGNTTIYGGGIIATASSNQELYNKTIKQPWKINGVSTAEYGAFDYVLKDAIDNLKEKFGYGTSRFTAFKSVSDFSKVLGLTSPYSTVTSQNNAAHAQIDAALTAKESAQSSGVCSSSEISTTSTISLNLNQYIRVFGSPTITVNSVGSNTYALFIKNDSGTAAINLNGNTYQLGQNKYFVVTRANNGAIKVAGPYTTNPNVGDSVEVNDVQIVILDQPLQRKAVQPPAYIRVLSHAQVYFELADVGTVCTVETSETGHCNVVGCGVHSSYCSTLIGPMQRLVFMFVDTPVYHWKVISHEILSPTYEYSYAIGDAAGVLDSNGNPLNQGLPKYNNKFVTTYTTKELPFRRDYMSGWPVWSHYGVCEDIDSNYYRVSGISSVPVFDAIYVRNNILLRLSYGAYDLETLNSIPVPDYVYPHPHFGGVNFDSSTFVSYITCIENSYPGETTNTINGVIGFSFDLTKADVFTFSPNAGVINIYRVNFETQTAEKRYNVTYSTLTALGQRTVLCNKIYFPSYTSGNFVYYRWFDFTDFSSGVIPLATDVMVGNISCRLDLFTAEFIRYDNGRYFSGYLKRDLIFKYNSPVYYISGEYGSVTNSSYTYERILSTKKVHKTSSSGYFSNSLRFTKYDLVINKNGEQVFLPYPTVKKPFHYLGECYTTIEPRFIENCDEPFSDVAYIRGNSLIKRTSPTPITYQPVYKAIHKGSARLSSEEKIYQYNYLYNHVYDLEPVVPNIPQTGVAYLSAGSINVSTRYDERAILITVNGKAILT